MIHCKRKENERKKSFHFFFLSLCARTLLHIKPEVKCFFFFYCGVKFEKAAEPFSPPWRISGLGTGLPTSEPEIPKLRSLFQEPRSATAFCDGEMHSSYYFRPEKETRVIRGAWCSCLSALVRLLASDVPKETHDTGGLSASVPLCRSSTRPTQFSSP